MQLVQVVRLDLLVQILDSFDGSDHFHIEVSVVFLAQTRVIGDYPAVVQQRPTNLHLAVERSMLTAPVSWVALFGVFCLLLITLGKLPFAHTLLHASCLLVRGACMITMVGCEMHVTFVPSVWEMSTDVPSNEVLSCW